MPPLEPYITAPLGGETFLSGAGVQASVTWTTEDAPISGAFGVWLVHADGSQESLGTVDAVCGQTSYSLPWDVTQARGSYSISVAYGLTAGDWLYWDQSEDFTIASAGLTVTNPAAGDTIAGELGQQTAVTWDAAGTPATGIFGIWAVSSGGAWYELGRVNADGQAEHL